MKSTKLEHETKINVIRTVNLQIFREINQSFIKFKKYL